MAGKKRVEKQTSKFFKNFEVCIRIDKFLKLIKFLKEQNMTNKKINTKGGVSFSAA